MAEERRSTHRVRISGVRVLYESAAGERIEANALDLGGGGLFVRTAAPLAVGKRISLEIEVIGETGPWSALGRVVWVREKSEGDGSPPGMGIKLIDADPAVLAALDRLVETREFTEPGVGKGSTPPPAAPVIAVGPERERTLMGVGLAPETSPAPVRPVPSAPLASSGALGQPARLAPLPREASIAIDLIPRSTKKPVSAPPLPATVVEKRGGGAGRLVVILMLLVVAGVAAYVLLDGFLQPPPTR
jgi:uncharacterized protein (TIGR02266 family)